MEVSRVATFIHQPQLWHIDNESRCVVVAVAVVVYVGVVVDVSPDVDFEQHVLSYVYCLLSHSLAFVLLVVFFS